MCIDWDCTGTCDIIVLEEEKNTALGLWVYLREATLGLGPRRFLLFTDMKQ